MDHNNLQFNDRMNNITKTSSPGDVLPDHLDLVQLAGSTAGHLQGTAVNEKEIAQ